MSIYLYTYLTVYKGTGGASLCSIAGPGEGLEHWSGVSGPSVEELLYNKVQTLHN